MTQCETCKERLYTDRETKSHQCPPRFECVNLDEFENFEDFAEPGDAAPEWTIFYTRYPNDAAIKFARTELDYEGAIRVRVRNEHGVEIDLKVEAEWELRFDAGPDGHYTQPGYWDRSELAMSWKFHERTEPVIGRAEGAQTEIQRSSSDVDINGL
jgi:hypothetical protein